MRMQPDRAPRGRARRRGSALIVALSVMTPMMIIMGSMMMALASHQKEVEQREGRATAQSLSASGAHHALALLQEDPNFVGTYQIPLPGGAVQVTITDWGVDGIDNDQVDGADDPGEENILAITAEGWVNPSFTMGSDPFLKYAAAQTLEPVQSDPLLQTTLDPTLDPTLLDPSQTGTYQYPTSTTGDVIKENRYTVSSVRRYSRRSELLVRRIPLEIDINQTVYIDDPLASFKVDGTAFLFSGNDTNLDGTAAATGVKLPAIGTPGDPDAIISQILAHQYDNVVGAAGSPSVGSVAPQDLDQIIGLLSQRAAIVYPEGDKVASPTLGTQEEPVVTWSQGNLEIGGTSSGCGVLIVDGDLTLGGTFEYTGLIICTGSVVFQGGGYKKVKGGLLALGSIETLGDLRFSGNVEMQFSTEAMDIVRQAAFSKPAILVLAWMEE